MLLIAPRRSTSPPLFPLAAAPSYPPSVPLRRPRFHWSRFHWWRLPLRSSTEPISALPLPRTSFLSLPSRLHSLPGPPYSIPRPLRPPSPALPPPPAPPSFAELDSPGGTAPARGGRPAPARAAAEWPRRLRVVAGGGRVRSKCSLSRRQEGCLDAKSARPTAGRRYGRLASQNNPCGIQGGRQTHSGGHCSCISSYHINV